MKPAGRIYDRIAEVEEELWDIGVEESAEKTFIKGEAFDHKEWLEAEAEALQEEKENMEKTLSISGEFTGLA